MTKTTNKEKRNKIKNKKHKNKEQRTRFKDVQDAELLSKEQLKKIQKNKVCAIGVSGKRKHKMLKRIRHQTKEKMKMDEKDLFDDLMRMMWKLKGSGSLSHGRPKNIPAFSAYRKSIQALSAGTILVFDQVFTNNGKGYSPSTGVFTAPIPGLYHFTAVVMSEQHKQLYVRLFHNSTKISSSYITDQGYKTGSFDVVLRLAKGDTVAIKSGNNGQNMFSNGDNYSTFSGYFISE